MAESFESPQLYADHQPETHRTLNADHSVSEQELPGHVEVGVLLHGVKVALARIPAGNLLQQFERDRSGQGTPQQPSGQ